MTDNIINITQIIIRYKAMEEEDGKSVVPWWISL